MKRLFIAVNLPEKLKEKIFQNFSQKIKIEGMKIVKQQNLHITLKFLGNFDEKNLEELKEKLNAIAFEKFEAKVLGVGEFNGRVIWVGVLDEQNYFEQINEELNNALGTVDKRFHPHITIARNKKLKKSEVKKIVSELKQLRFKEKLLVKSIDLMESRLGSKGAEYFKVFQKDSD